MSKVEEVARAIAEWQSADPWEHLTSSQRHRLRMAAKSAIAAMREPSEAMLKAIVDAEHAGGYVYSAGEHMDAEGGWRIMIDAALQE